MFTRKRISIPTRFNYNDNVHPNLVGATPFQFQQGSIITVFNLYFNFFTSISIPTRFNYNTHIAHLAYLPIVISIPTRFNYNQAVSLQSGICLKISIPTRFNYNNYTLE